MAINGLMNFFFLRLFFCIRTTGFSDWWQDRVLLLANELLETGVCARRVS